MTTIDFRVEINLNGYVAAVDTYHLRRAIAEYYEVTGMRPEHVTVTPIPKFKAGTISADSIKAYTIYTVGSEVHRKGSGRIGKVTQVKDSGLLDVLWNPDRSGQQHETFNLRPEKVELASKMKFRLTRPNG